MASFPSPWSDPQVVATVIAAFATVVYVIVTIGILRATNENTQVTRYIFEAAHRPYVFVKSITFGPLRRDPRIRAVLFEFSNAGSLPARDFFWDILITRDGRRIP